MPLSFSLKMSQAVVNALLGDYFFFKINKLTVVEEAYSFHNLQMKPIFATSTVNEVHIIWSAELLPAKLKTAYPNNRRTVIQHDSMESKTGLLKILFLIHDFEVKMM